MFADSSEGNLQSVPELLALVASGNTKCTFFVVDFSAVFKGEVFHRQGIKLFGAIYSTTLFLVGGILLL